MGTRGEAVSVGRTFEKVFHVRWGDIDFNAHMKNTAYYKEMRLLEPYQGDPPACGPERRRVAFLFSKRVLSGGWQAGGARDELGGWLDLAARRVIAPPEQLAAVLRELETSEEFRAIDSGGR